VRAHYPKILRYSQLGHPKGQVTSKLINDVHRTIVLILSYCYLDNDLLVLLHLKWLMVETKKDWLDPSLLTRLNPLGLDLNSDKCHHPLEITIILKVIYLTIFILKCKILRDMPSTPILNKHHGIYIYGIFTFYF
jgi:hypothetical protein